MIACAAPSGDLGVAIRLSGWFDCQARALGENGFQALVGGPVATGLLSGLVTIFVALIGYGLVLGRTPSLADGVGWAVRLGVVLALVTGWPAFQTLVYRVAVDGPGEVAGVLLPATGLPSEGVETRVQQAYDTIRLGSPRTLAERIAADPGAGAAAGTTSAPPVGGGQPLLRVNPATEAKPRTASLLAVATIGVVGATRLAAGYLLAVAPLAILALLFDRTLGFFAGWLRALAGAALAQVGALLVTGVGLLAVEGELAHLQAAEIGAAAPSSVDPQALVTILLCMAAAMIAVVFAAVRMAGALRIDPILANAAAPGQWAGATAQETRSMVSATLATTTATRDERPRAAAVTDALAATVQRQLRGARNGTDGAAATRYGRVIPLRTGTSEPAVTVGSDRLGAHGRRAAPRRTRSAGQRDARR